MRIDLYLFQNNFCSSRSKARQLISENAVSVNGKTVTKPSFDVTELDNVEVSETNASKYVGRGALKLEHALKEFNVEVENKICADIGASTGGFTQVLLNNNAKLVYAIDSGTDQLADILKQDSRVVSMENTNARFMTSDFLEHKASLIVMDVSFISQITLYPAIINIADRPCDIITLVKPQFETNSKSSLGKHGVIKDEKVRKKALQNVIDSAISLGFCVISHTTSPITGGSGNVEYLLHMRLE